MTQHGSEENNFSDIGLAAFLAADERPTLVFDRSTGHVTFTNPAFDSLKERISSAHNEEDDIVNEIISLGSNSTLHRTVHLGQTWTFFTIEGLWRVASCVSEFSSSFTNGQSESSSRGRPLEFVERPIPKRTKISSQYQQTDGHSTQSLKRKVHEDSVPSSIDDGKGSDWIRSAIQTISPYVDLFCNHDWDNTALGPIDLWPTDLRTLVLSVLTNPDPRLLLWGDQYIVLYNEACVPIIGSKHPHALGQGPIETFSELWSDVEPIVAAAFKDVRTTKVDRMPITIERAGFLEETYFHMIMQPVFGEDAKPIAAFDQFTEVTNIVMAERRMNTVLKVGENAASSESLDEVWKGFFNALEANVDDVPFAALYCVQDLDADHREYLSPNSTPSDWKCSLTGSVRLDVQSSSIPVNLDFSDDRNPMMQRIRLCWKLGEPVLLSTEDETLPIDFIRAASNRTPDIVYTQAVACPISSATSAGCLGFLLLGLSPRRPYDEDYQHFVRLLNDRLTYSTAAVALPKEYRQIQAAAEETALRHAALSKKLLRRTQEAEKMEAKFTRMAASSPVGCYLLRVDGTPIYLNEAYYRITGIEKPSQLSFGSDSIWREQVIPEDIPKVEECWYDIVDRKRPSMVEYRLRREWTAFDHATGIEMRGPTWLLVTALPELDDDGIVQTVIGWVNDISLQKWTENMQTSRLAEALEGKRQSERFIDVVSHEMRNPLSAILQSADHVLTTLQDHLSQKGSSRPNTSNQADFIDIAIESAQTIILCAQHQKRIVDDILTLSKLDANLMVLCPESVRPEELTRKALKMYEAELENANITARITVDQSYHNLAVDSVLLDPSRLLQVLINLLTNAIKFTKESPRRYININIEASRNLPESSPPVSYIPRRESRPEVLFTQDWGTGSELYLLFAVQDTGRGLEEEEVKSLFVRFAQASPRTDVQYGGSGLGLFISKELTELQGGQIGVSSVSGEGSTFQFYIKARKDVKETRRKLERAVLDAMDMPEPLNQPNERSRTYSLVSLQQEADAEVGGMDRNVLIPTIGRISSPLPTPIPVSPPELNDSSDYFAQQLHVLVVEDNIINQKVMVAGLKKLGCNVHVANNGVEAIDFLERSTFARADYWERNHQDAYSNKAEHEIGAPLPLSLILMDLEMPVMDGLTCIQRIREMQKTGELVRHVPVAAVTANARPEQLNTALKYGMDVVITKPFRIPELLPKMRQMIAGKVVPNSNPVFSHVEWPSGG